MLNDAVNKQTSIEKKSIDTIRAIALDSVNKAQSGHTGTAMSLAPLAYLLFTKILNYNNEDTTWINRDRFILSGGHVSILHYAMLYLTNSGLELDDLKEFRQLGSLTPGHPEVGHTKGIEYTTGPLGQGFSNGVGCAISEKHLRARFGSELVEHYIYATCGDGDMQEGISHEAASLAGHLKLGKLIYFYDDNKITIDGPTDLSMSDNTALRFESYNWHVQDIGENGENLEALEEAILNAQNETEKPSLIIIRTHIAYPSKKFLDTSAGHGAILDEDEIVAVKEKLELSTTPFDYDPKVIENFSNLAETRREAYKKWSQNYTNLQNDSKSLIEEFLNATSQEEIVALESTKFETGDSIATRSAIKKSIQNADKTLSSLMAGSADLTGNTGMQVTAEDGFHINAKSNQIYFGIREHVMGAVANGIALAHGLIPLVGTFFVFSDYMKPAIRLAALSNAKVGFIFTHDSVGVGEDGPTHQPIEQLAGLRAIPNLTVWRPADAREVDAAFNQFIENETGPNLFVLTRQNVPVLKETEFLENEPELINRGAYVLSKGENPQLTLVATGSEVSLALETQKLLKEENIETQVVSMPSWEKYNEQSSEYQNTVIPLDIPSIGIEAGTTLGWEAYVDIALGINEFGVSAPAEKAFEKFDFTPEKLTSLAIECVNLTQVSE